MEYPDVIRAWLDDVPVVWRNQSVRITAGGCVNARIVLTDPATSWHDGRKSSDRWVEIHELEAAPPGTVVPKAASGRPALQLNYLEE